MSMAFFLWQAAAGMLGMSAILGVFLSGVGLLSGWCIQGAFLILVPQITSMDFRLIAWTWPAWAILFAAALTSGDERRTVFLPSAVLCSLGIFAHLCFLLSIPPV